MFPLNHYIYLLLALKEIPGITVNVVGSFSFHSRVFLYFYTYTNVRAEIQL